MKNKVFLLAYMNTNLGDDLFVETICKRYQNVQFKIYCTAEIWRELKPISNLSNVYLWRTEELVQKLFRTETPLCRFLMKCVSYVSAKKTARIRKSCCAVVKIGGSIFMEQPVDGAKPRNLSKLDPVPGAAFAKSIIEPPQFIIGANIGPVYTQAYLHTVAEELKSYKSVVFRDKASYNLYRNFPNVRYAPDVIFQYRTENLKDITSKKQVFISIISLENREGRFDKQTQQGYYEKMAEVTQCYINLGYEVVMASFCKREGDLEAIDKVQKLLPLETKMHTRVISYEGESESILAEIMQSEFLICCRFHSVVLSLLMGKPVYPISYGDKTTNLLADLHFSGNWTTIDKWKDIPNGEIDANRLQKITANVTQFVTDAQKQFEMLDAFLEGAKT